MREATPSDITEKMRAGFRAARGRYLESGLACLQKGALPREHTRALVIAVVWIRRCCLVLILARYLRSAM